MDEVARVASTAFTISNGLRRDTELTILFVAAPPPRARRIRLESSELRYLNPDERSTAALLKNALVRSSTLDRDIEASPGLHVGPADPATVLTTFARQPGTVWLHEGGVPYEPGLAASAEVGAILSDPDNLTAHEQQLLEGLGVPAVSIGPVSLRASQCVDVLHHLWDRMAPASGTAER